MIADPSGYQFTAIIAIILGAVTPAFAKPLSQPDHEARLGACIVQASGGRTWLERTLWGLRDQEAGWIGAEIANTNGTHDLGPLQINSFWVPRLSVLVGRSPANVWHWLVTDPCFNVQAARWIFLSGLAVTRDYWDAIGVYHSPAASRQHRYRNGVAGHLIARFGRDVFSHSLQAGYGSEGRDRVVQTVQVSAQPLKGGKQ
ncbi:lytic transglycosylase domain-containing protein [Sphingobium sp. EM0848]|uniref:lytic transglycosylase domain-containing protein n=1 Tax=Sphingobium sp. EM0848 TaxID=2743473 RepID=UPI00159BFD8B|nr:lytic transglycosylase domain-containing protein [Sphingobium sp. EM0848]